MDASELPTQIMGSPDSLNQANSYSQDVDLEAPTQMLPQSHDEEATMNDGDGKKMKIIKNTLVFKRIINHLLTREY